MQVAIAPAALTGWGALRRRVRRTYAGYFFVTPAALLIVVFSVVAIVVSLYISFFQWDILSDTHPFLGLANYRQALAGDDLFWIALRNTAYYVVFVVPGITVLGFGLALIANEALFGRAVFRTIYFLPSITPMVVIALIWIWLYTPDGLLNTILGALGLPQPNWLSDPNTAMPAIIVMSVWQAVGYYTAIYMAGLADIPQDFYDAAKVDGANRLQEIWHITIPLLRNVTIFVTVTLAIAAFQMFTQVYVMTQGGPVNATETMQAIIYKNAFRYFKMGYAAAISWLLFLVIFALVAVQMRIFRSRETF
ncbi:MAG TPA: sugar ABC transporter permease [Chloroflexota bacterium]|nr:sugar ABC transporter permease [Chloroflexota bacterium]